MESAICTHRFSILDTFEENFSVVLSGFPFSYFITTLWAWNQGDSTRAKRIHWKDSCRDEWWTGILTHGSSREISASPDKTVNKRSPAKKLKPRKMKLNWWYWVLMYLDISYCNLNDSMLLLGCYVIHLFGLYLNLLWPSHCVEIMFKPWYLQCYSCTGINTHDASPF